MAQEWHLCYYVRNMQFTLKPGRYIVAASGGVDSMALLDVLRQDAHLTLVVAHVNHGIRPDAGQDEQLVKKYAEAHNLPFITTHLNLGSQASEERAREERYDFLRRCCKDQQALAIITAHHQDDLLETALLAIVRGTGWRGLAPFTEVTDVIRPLLDTPKWQLVAYARTHNVPWREDITNTDERYTRNYIRRTLMPMLDQKSETWRDIFLQQIRKQQHMRRTITELLASLCKNATIHRYTLVMAPRNVAYEILQQIFRRTTGNTLERPLAEAALLFAKTAKIHKVMELSGGWQMRSLAKQLIVEPRTP